MILMLFDRGACFWGRNTVPPQVEYPKCQYSDHTWYTFFGFLFFVIRRTIHLSLLIVEINTCTTKRREILFKICHNFLAALLSRVPSFSQT